MGGRVGVGVHVRSSPSERRRYTQLLRYSTQEAAREKRPRRSRNELCNSGAAEQPEGAHGSRIGLFNESFKQGASR